MHEQCGKALDRLMLQAVENGARDNLSCVVIGLGGFEKMVKSEVTPIPT